MIRLIVGLGNPGTEYERTRHNVGFWWVDGAARKLGASLRGDRSYHGLLARVNRREGPLYLLEPQTYMNLSGKSVGALARFFKIAPAEMLVVHDEIDLAARPDEAQARRRRGRPQRPQRHPGPARQRRLLAPAHRRGPPGQQGRGGRLGAVQALGGAAPGDRVVRRAIARRLGFVDRWTDGARNDEDPCQAEGRARGTQAMSRLMGFAVVLALGALAQAAAAQDRVYRCGAEGHSYSQQPCANGASVEVADARSAAQVTQAQQVAQRDAQLAEALVRQRQAGRIGSPAARPGNDRRPCRPRRHRVPRQRGGLRSQRVEARQARKGRSRHAVPRTPLTP